MVPSLFIIFFAGGEGEADGGIAHFAQATLYVTPRADGIAVLEARARGGLELLARATEAGVGTLSVAARAEATLEVSPRAEASLSIEGKRP